MLGGLRDHAQLSGLLPFAAMFYARSSRYLFYDAEGRAHEVLQGEGWEQGDPLPHLGSHPGRRAARPPDRRRPGGLAARLAISRDADSQPTLSQSRDIAGHAAKLPSHAPLPGWAARGGLAFSHTRRAKHDLDSASHAPGFAPSLAATPAPEPPPVRPKPGVRPGGRRTGGPCAGLSRRAKVVERAWLRVAREAVGPEGQVVPQQWLAHTTAPGVRPDDRRRLDMVVYGATTNGGALCCDATLVSPLTRAGDHPQPRGDTDDGAALQVAERRKQTAYPELTCGGPQRLVVLGAEVGGRWNAQALRFLRDLVHLRAQRAPPAVRAAAASGWPRRWQGIISIAVQQAVAGTALGRAWPAQPQAGPGAGPSLERVLDLVGGAGASRLPMRL